MVADDTIPVFDRGGQESLGNPDDARSGTVGGITRTRPVEIQSPDIVEAEKALPDLPDETADGLDPMDDEIRHQAEDVPRDTARR